MKLPVFECDGGFIMVSWDKFDEGIEWYSKHMGWKCADVILSPLGKKAFFPLPDGGQVTLKSFESKFDHFKQEDGFEGHIRLGFRLADLEANYAYFQKHDIEVSEITELPNGIRTFDFYGFENTRITATEDSRKDGLYPDSRLIGFGYTRIGVTNLDNAIPWYEDIIGMKKKVDQELPYGYSRMDVKLSKYGAEAVKKEYIDDVWLEPIPQGSKVEKSNPSVRTYFYVKPELFRSTHQLLAEKGIETSKTAGEPEKGFAGFHFFDPDGNRLNVWSYPIF
ncbi:VOC family protein [Chengkuizengella axinellae]|uniref:VOC family protein n=1 Tax=Chengkuizengella axinellae TaxID=3064388 RepID=A0ABT9J4E9_9BACL|nr:VOC family protein [Chengkuizengella sp. 2205SS18-9]MDP5275850.1 VOC family protein [Chengkuizengella sp. 2205SS18-9]